MWYLGNGGPGSLLSRRCSSLGTRRYVRSRVSGAWNKICRVISRGVLVGDFVVNQLEEEPATSLAHLLLLRRLHFLCPPHQERM